MKKPILLPFVLILSGFLILSALISQVFAGYRFTDPSWGRDGVIVTDFNERDDIVTSLFRQHNGKLMVAGWVDIDPGDFGVARYLPNSRLDKTFGDEGRVTTSFNDDPEFADAAWSVNRDRDGGYLVFGETCNAGYLVCELALAGYHADGSLNKDFGQSGLVTTNPGTVSAVAWPRRSIYQTNGKLVAAGAALQESGDVDMLLLRYNPDGSLDESFGKEGITIIDFEETGNYPQDIIPLWGNKILVIGSFGEPEADDPFIYEAEIGFAAVFNRQGALDSSFANGDGYFTWAYKNLNTGGQTALLIDDDLYVMSYVDTNNGDCALQRIDLNGQLDKTFGDKGWVLIGGREFNYCWDLALTPDSKLAFAGENIPVYRSNKAAAEGPALDMRRRPVPSGSSQARMISRVLPDDVPTILVGRYNLDGTPDENFGHEGLVRYAINEEGNGGLGLAVQPDGKMLVISNVYVAEDGHYDWGVVRFLSEGVAAPVYLPVMAR